jgi:hypothetical protein
MEGGEQTYPEVKALLERLNSEGEAKVDRILVRQIHKYYYSCQIWTGDDKQPNSRYISLDTDS